MPTITTVPPVALKKALAPSWTAPFTSRDLVRHLKGACLAGACDTIAVLVDECLPRENGTNILQEVRLALTKSGSERGNIAAENLWNLVSCHANWAPKVPGTPGLQSTCFALPFYCDISKADAKAHAAGDPVKLSSRVLSVALRAVAKLPKSCSVAIDPHLYRASEFLVAGPGETRHYVENFTAALLRGDSTDAPQLQPAEVVPPGKSLLGLYVITGVIISPDLSRQTPAERQALETFLNALVSGPDMRNFEAVAAAQIKAQLPGCHAAEYFNANGAELENFREIRLDRMAQYFEHFQQLLVACGKNS